MLGKLIKKNFKELSVPYGILFLVSLLIIGIFEAIIIIPYAEPVTFVVRYLIFTAYSLITSGILFITEGIYIVHFHKKMIGNQAYLTFTLPAKPKTIIFSHGVVTFIWKIIFVAVLGLGAMLLIFSVFNSADGAGIKQEIINEVGIEFLNSLPLILLKYAFAILIGMIGNIIIVYFCMAFGQMFGKFKLAASICMFFIIYVISQGIAFLATAQTGIITLSTNTTFTQSEVSFGDLESVYYQFVDESIICIFVMTVITSIILIPITNYIFTKKLNLE